MRLLSVRQLLFEKGVDKRFQIVYNTYRAPREWRNWQTRTFEGRVVYTVRVQVPFSAPNSRNPNPKPVGEGFGFLFVFGDL